MFTPIANAATGTGTVLIDSMIGTKKQPTTLHVIKPDGSEQQGYEFDPTYPESNPIQLALHGVVHHIENTDGYTFTMSLNDSSYMTLNAVACPPLLDGGVLSCTLTKSNKNHLVTVTLTPTEKAKQYTGDYSWRMNMTISFNHSWQTGQNKTILTCGGQSWTLFNRKPVNNPIRGGSTHIDTTVRPAGEAGGHYLWMGGDNRALWYQRLNNKPTPPAATRDDLYWARLHFTSGDMVKTINPYVNNLLYSLYMAYDPLTPGTFGHVDNPYHSLTRVNATSSQLADIDKARSLLQPGQWAWAVNTDGTFTVAMNAGPQIGSRALSMSESQIPSQVIDQNTRALIANAKQKQLTAMIRYARFDIRAQHDTVPQTLTGVCATDGLTVSSGECAATSKVPEGSGAGQKPSFVAYKPNPKPGDEQRITGVMSDQTGVVGDTWTLMANKYSYAGYRFTGWNTQPDGKGVAYQLNGGTYTYVAGGLVLYAQWEQLPSVSVLPATGGVNRQPFLLTVGGLLILAAGLPWMIRRFAHQDR